MADIAAEAAKAAAKATGASETKRPAPLTWGERATAACLFVAGLIVIGVTLFAFSSTDANFTFKAKEKTVTEPAPLVAETNDKAHASPKPKSSTVAGGEKTTKEVDYADTVVIFALTLGAALTLAGGFYGRLRSLKLGGLELNFVSPDDLKAASDKAAEKVEEKNIPDPDKKAAAMAAAQQVAVSDLTKAAALGVQPTERVIEGIADQAATKVVDAIG